MGLGGHGGWSFEPVEWGPVIASSITGCLALVGIVWQSRKTRQVGTYEHVLNGDKLDSIELKIDHASRRIDKVHDRLTDHVETFHTDPIPAIRKWSDL